jgi:ribA/ribD-fused uncharacterized protein
MTDTIDEFTGKYRFLSNFYLAPVRFNQTTFPSNEHAFQAAKTHNNLIRDLIAYHVEKPGDAKKIGRDLRLRSDWERVKLDIMHRIVYSKFALNDDLARKLLKTGNAELIEGNNWGDEYWGMVLRGRRKDEWVGENHLGNILMQVRSELSA